MKGILAFFFAPVYFGNSKRKQKRKGQTAMTDTMKKQKIEMIVDGEAQTVVRSVKNIQRQGATLTGEISVDGETIEVTGTQESAPVVTGIRGRVGASKPAGEIVWRTV